MKLFIFDMDGTVLDSMPALTDAAIDVIMEIYGETHALTEEKVRHLYESTVGTPFHAQLERIFPQDRRNSVADSRYEQLHAELCATMKVAKRLEVAMDVARSEGVQLALVSSTDRYLIHGRLPQVVALGWNWIGGFAAMQDKAYQLQEVRRYLGATDVTYFGDTPYDQTLAHRYHLNFRLVSVQTVSSAIYEILL